MSLGLKKGDQVFVLAGKDKGKKGKVIEVRPGSGTVLVEGINVNKKHMKQTAKTPAGIVDRVAPLPLGKVMLICGGCNKPTRIRIKTAEDGTRLRSCKRCGETI